jgi:hypothetical protein
MIGFICQRVKQSPWLSTSKGGIWPQDNFRLSDWKLCPER